MLQTHQCLNCCGLRIESVRYEEICPNCGDLMTLSRWNLDELLVESDSRGRTEPNQTEFVNIGSLLSDEPMLLSYAMNEEYLRQATEKHNLAALFVRPEDVAQTGLPDHITAVYSQHPQMEFFLFHNWLIENTEFYGKHLEPSFPDYGNYGHLALSNAMVNGLAIIHDAAIISNAIIESGATIGAGAIVGVDGARLIQKPDGTFFCALHGGSVHIGAGAYVGANAVVVRSLWRKPTTIGAGAYVGNLVNVGHNVQIEPGAIVLPGAFLGGRCIIKSTGRVSMGAAITNGVRIAGTVNMGGVVTQDVPEWMTVSGNFAVEHELQIGHVKRLASGLHADQMPIVR